MTVNKLSAFFVFFNLAFSESALGLRIFATNNVTYGQDYLYLQFRSVKSDLNVTANKLTVTVQKNATNGFMDVLETNFETITWKDSDVQSRSCSGTMKGACASTLDIQISVNSVNCMDTGLYRGIVDYSDGLNSTEQVNIEVKVVPDKIGPIKLLTGQNDSLPFHIDSQLILQCIGNVGDPPKDIYWCIQRFSDENISTYHDDITKSTPSLIGCQYTKSSNLTYVVSDEDRVTTMRCYAGDSGQCSNNDIPFAEYKFRRRPRTVSAGNKKGMYTTLFLVLMLETAYA